MITFAISHLFLVESSCTNTTKSPTWKFRFGQFHFWRDCRVAKTSFFHKVQNSLHTCWTCHQFFWQYISSFWNIPGGGIIFVFMLSNCIGLSGTILFTSPILSQVIGLELIISSTSTSDVLDDSSLRLSHCWFSRAARMLPADLISHFHTAPKLLAVGGLCLQINHSPPRFIKKSLIFFLPISLNALFSSVLAPIKLLPLSLRIILIFPLLLMSLQVYE